MIFFDLSLPINRIKVRDYYFEGDVWKKIITTLGALFALSVALSAIELQIGLFSVHYASTKMPYHMGRAEMSHHLAFLRARQRMFYQMYGEERGWSPKQRATYGALASLTKQYEQHSTGSVQTAQAVALPPSRAPQQSQVPHTMPEGVPAPVPERREDQHLFLAGNP